ncbi:long-chain-fatty-acid--CoA ligase [Corynebacterium epidermidicanis]|uniref:Acyl-CoA synthetase (AMP-forming)/AMP-acid ligase II n=1 Tax=Corynebacterium epidermidicanis TaxID=1050174 RepID=A0A0G3GYY0_9CORY|nr:long-chain-fatty-acid--CoA ligase [Corynebacterium epidermidicanis]AKK04062.1 acyl-CoA synthetase (AMP-forming)/AMP-acid ligase II [Corynebacterium epidermidicanis]
MSAADTKAWLKHYPEWVPHNLDYRNLTILDAYDNNLAFNADRTALNFFGRTQTYAELDAQVRRAAAGLRAFGVRPGDRVAILLPNCPQHIIAFYAILKLGATVVEHNPLYTAHELTHPFQDHAARVAICWDKSAPMLEKLRETTPLETIISVDMTEAMPRLQRLALRLPVPQLRKTRAKLTGEAPNTVPWEVLIGSALGGSGRDIETPESVTPETIALILYTSGTTGAPKGAQLSHGNMTANMIQGKHWVPNLGEQKEVFLAALPMFHAYGLTMVALEGVYCGAEIVLLPAPDMKLIMQVMKKYKPTWIPGVPALYEKIVEAAVESNLDISSVRAAFSGASSLPVSTVEKWERLTGGRLVEGYGLTECSPILVGNPMDGNRRPGYIGIPFPDTDIRIANPDNLDEAQPDGTEGEVLARGPQVFKGYLNQPEATANSFHNGWYRTGDIGVMEEDGFIRLVARIKEIIITGGFNVYPSEVEEVLLAHPDIKECAVVGMPRADGSENVCAAITLVEGAALDPEGLKEYCREQLTRYKVPRKFYHFEQLPQDQMGKIRRREVQAQLIARYGGNPS